VEPHSSQDLYVVGHPWPPAGIAERAYAPNAPADFRRVICLQHIYKLYQLRPASVATCSQDGGKIGSILCELSLGAGTGEGNISSARECARRRLIKRLASRACCIAFRAK
jgi:hypothetical protein